MTGHHELRALDLVCGDKAEVQTYEAELEWALDRISELEKETDRARTKPPPADQLKTIGEAAAKLHVSHKTVRGLIRDGTLRCINVGRGTIKPRLRITGQDLNELIEKRKGGAQCQSSNTDTPTRRFIGMTSDSKVVAFSALQRKPSGAKPKP